MLNSALIPKAYACYNKSKRTLQKSSSGGVFFSIASTVIKKYKGVVYGCVIKNGDVFHSRTEDMKGLFPMLGSKYVRSNLKNTFEECKDDLSNDRYVLFSGTPCQINALYLYLDQQGINKEKLVGIDVVCHGTPKPFFWKKYLETNFGGRDISDISFRYKITKWDWKTFSFKTTNNIKVGGYISPYYSDPFIKAFLNNKILTESCFKCQCKGENRKADITLGDFWGIEKLNPKLENGRGTSFVILRHKNSFLMKIIKKHCVLNEVPYLDSFYLDNWSYYKSVENRFKGLDDNELCISDNSIKQDKTNVMPSFKHFLYSIFFKKVDVPPCVLVHSGKTQKNNKIGIITDYGYRNYGNRLQNYALFYLLRSFGKEPYNIVEANRPAIWARKIINFLRKKNNSACKFGLEPKQSIVDASLRYEGKTVRVSNSKKDLKKLLGFSTIIIGSDQVWNAKYHHYQSDLKFYLGNFGIVNRPFKLTSYAASICIKKFSLEEQEAFYYSLLSFDNVSVREKGSKELLESIGISSRVDLDPTLLLSKDDWNKAINKYKTVEPPKNDYLFSYLFENKENRYIYPNGYSTIVDCLEDGGHYSDSNQFDFINLIKNAGLIVTNSFHALVFSIIFKKKIIIYDRHDEGMEQRFDELLSLFSLKFEFNKLYDFSAVNFERFEVKKHDSFCFLKEIVI